jgi:hypothetical protein
MYSGDNAEKLVTNSDRQSAPRANWICAFGVTLDWSTKADNTNTLYITDSSWSLMGDYVGKSVKSFVCPADNNLTGAQRGAGWTTRLRSCAMNGAMGDGTKYYGVGSPGNASMPKFYNAKKTTDLHTPGPSDCWMLTDEHPNSNDDATFFVDPAAATVAGTAFNELPGSMHGDSAALVFGDGHSEVHRWKGSVTVTKFDAARTSYLQFVGNLDAGSVNDLTWFAQHTPQN